MPEELTYVIVTPYTLRKSRTGGILSRLLTRTALDLVAARLFAPSPALVKEYAETLGDAKHTSDKHKNQVNKLVHSYVLKNFSQDPATGKRHRVLMWIFRGENAVAKVRECVGDVSHRSITGESIRDTYGDYVLDEDGEVAYFEPAVLAPDNAREAEQKLKIWAKYSETDGGLLTDVLPYPRTPNTQRTLVIIKPDNFSFPSGKPGNVMDMFSKTGLYIVAFKVNRMSVEQAEQFYGPVLPVLREKFKELTGKRSADLLAKEFNLSVTDDLVKEIGNVVGPSYANTQFEDIVRFMSGRRPRECTAAQKKQPGTEKSIVIVYEGENAVAKVREVLGPTDPRKAPPGSIRREFGQNIMINAAHASDSPENAKREMKILNIGENNLASTINAFFSKRKNK
jgi:nucleoside diphosphate kinase